MNNYPNCKFIDTTDVMVSTNNFNFVSKSFMCSKLNIEIDNINFQKIVSSQLKLRYKHLQSKNSSNVTKTICQKGTIPYYFAKQPKVTNQVLKPKINCDDTSQPMFFRD